MRPDLASLKKALFPLQGQRVTTINFKERLEGALSWIQSAHRASSDGGISKGYDTLRARWDRSYPETTGYTVPTLLNVARAYQRPELKLLALSLADYLLDARTPEGGVSHWANAKQEPVVFDTGQVMFGWLAAYHETGAPKYLEAAQKAGLWLTSIQDPSGSWKTGQHQGVEKVIDTRVAWALLQLHLTVPLPEVRRAAISNLEFALSRQDADGWFRDCSFSPTEDPFTHTLAYTAEGLYECGKILNDTRYLDAGRLTALALFDQRRDDGSLASTFAAGWKETSRSSCLTGNCQAALLWLALYSEPGGDPKYLRAAESALAFVSRFQPRDRANERTYGGIPGSAPFFGIYERFKYPNWAVKFFLDAVLTLERAKGSLPDFTEGYAG